jgi:predicted dehydrogenase
MWIGRRDSANGSMLKDPALMSAEARPYAVYPGGHTEGYPDTFMQLFRDFYEYIAAGDWKAPRTFPTFQTGHDEMLLCDAILKSSQTKAWEPVEWD